MQYLPFELSVDARGDREYEISVRSPAGEVRGRTRFPFEGAELANYHGALEEVLEVSRSSRDLVRPSDDRSAPERLKTVKSFGAALFATLMPANVLVAYRTSAVMAAAQGSGLRLQLRVQAPEMAALPWEFMFDTDDRGFVSLNPNTPVVRYTEVARPVEVLSIKLPLRILGMVASPTDLARLDKDEERSRIESAVKSLESDRKVELQWVGGGTYRDLQKALRKGPWHILHFIGHGDFHAEGPDGGGGLIAMESNRPSIRVSIAGAGGASPTDVERPANLVPADALGQLLRGHPSLRLVILNSCLGARASATDIFSSTASTLVRLGLPAVVAMQHEITDGAAVTFAQAFYSSLADGAPVDRAVGDARAEINAQRRGSMEWGIPVLLMRSPTGELFVPGTTVSRSGSRRIRRASLATTVGLAAAPFVAAALLSNARSQRTEISLDARVSGVGFVLPTAQPLGDPIGVDSLGVSGLASINLPHATAGVTPIATDRVLLKAVPEGPLQGRIQLDLTSILPARTKVAVASSSERGVYELSLRDSALDSANALPRVGAPIVGRVRVIVPGALNAERDYPTPTVVQFVPEPGVTLGFSFAPAAGQSPSLAARLPADGLDLTRHEQFQSPTGTMTREVSTIGSGRIRFESLGSRELDLGASDELRLAGVHGEVGQLDLADDHLVLKVKARVESLSAVSGGVRRNLMPTLLDIVMARYARWAVGAAVLLAALAIGVLAWGRRHTP